MHKLDLCLPYEEVMVKATGRWYYRQNGQFFTRGKIPVGDPFAVPEDEPEPFDGEIAPPEPIESPKPLPIFKENYKTRAAAAGAITRQGLNAEYEVVPSAEGFKCLPLSQK